MATAASEPSFPVHVPAGIPALRALANTVMQQVDFVDAIISEYDRTLHALLQSTLSASDVEAARAYLAELRAKIGQHNLSMIHQAGLGTQLSGIGTSASTANGGHGQALLNTPPAALKKSTDGIVAPAVAKRKHVRFSDEDAAAVEKRRRLDQPIEPKQLFVPSEDSLSDNQCDFAAGADAMLAELDKCVRTWRLERICELYVRLRNHPNCPISALDQRCIAIAQAFGKLGRIVEAEEPARRALEFYGENSISAQDIMASVLCKLGPNRSVDALHHINRVLLLTENNQSKNATTRAKMARFRDGLLAAQSRNAGATGGISNGTTAVSILTQ